MKLPKFSFKKNLGSSGLVIFRVLTGILVVITFYNLYHDWRILSSTDKNQIDTKNNPLSIDFTAYDQVEKRLGTSTSPDQINQPQSSSPFEAGEGLPPSNDEPNPQPSAGQPPSSDQSTPPPSSNQVNQ